MDLLLQTILQQSNPFQMLTSVFFNLPTGVNIFQKNFHFHILVFITLFAKGSGPYNDKGILDDDTIQFTSYHYYDIAVSAVTINATAIMASNTTVIPTQITLDGSVVRKCSEVNLVSQNKYVPC